MFDSISHPGKRAFLAAFAETGNVKESAALAGVARETHYDWKAADPDYAAAFKDAELMAGDALEDEARARAMGASLSDKMLMFLLKGVKPEKFGTKRIEEKSHVTVRQEVDLSGLSDEELDTLERIASKVSPPEGD